MTISWSYSRLQTANIDGWMSVTAAVDIGSHSLSSLIPQEQGVYVLSGLGML